MQTFNGNARLTESAVREVTLTLDNGNVYAAGDVLAATQEVTSAVRVDGGSAVWQSAVVLDQDDQAQALDLVLLRTNVGIGAENAAVSVADADADEILGIVEVTAGDYVDLVNSQLVTKDNLGIVVNGGAGSSSLFIAAISRGTGTYTTIGITLKLGFLWD